MSKLLRFKMKPGEVTWYYDLSKPMKSSTGQKDYLMVHARNGDTVPAENVQSGQGEGPEWYVNQGIAEFVEGEEKAGGKAKN